MNNVTGLSEFTLGIFGGLNLSMQPTDLPAGLSPACSDVCFKPGSFQIRPPLARVDQLSANAQAIYHHSYVRPDGSVVQLVFLSDGSILADGVKIASTAPGNRFHCTNAFGKCYVAISDGQHGQDVPLQIDQNLNVDRVSQDGPGGGLTVQNYSLPAQALVSGSAGTPVPIATVQPINPQQVQTGGGYDPENPYAPPTYQTFYTGLLVTTTGTHGLTIGQTVNITGNTYSTYGAYIYAIDSQTSFEVGYNTPSNAPSNGGTATPVAALLVRKNGQVTASTAAPHQLNIGYKVVINGVADAQTSISSIVIDNNANSGVATITTTQPHGFVPGNDVAILNVDPVEVGGGVSTYLVRNGLCTVTTNTPHGLSAGTVIDLQLHTYSPRTETVAAVLSDTQFTAQTGDPDVTDTGGHVLVPWLAPSGDTFPVQSVPSVTTFTIAISGPSFTWTDGLITFAWNGTFFVTAVPSATTFSYAQSGPDATVQTGSGNVTPQGQIAPGNHTFWPVFFTRQGYLTSPGPPVKFNASGNQYVFFSNIPIGPPNVIARWIIATAADGSKKFSIPVPYQDGTQVQGTSTIVNDNVTTSAIMDFSDQALTSSYAMDKPGNNVFQQIVLDSALGFYYYSDRLVSWGMRNCLSRLYNLGFEGGVSVNAPNVPLGWTLAAPGTLVAGDYGQAFQFGTAGTGGAISQSIYQDQFGAPILQPNKQYTFRAWANGTITADLYSPSAGVLATASITAASGFAEEKFSAKTPVTVPPDTIVRIYAASVGQSVDEIRFVDTLNPYTMQAMASYVENPEAINGDTALFGPAGPLPVRAIYNRRDVLNLLTLGPDGKRYETESSASGEPSTWAIRTMSSKCGAISVWGNASFEDWEVWASDTGLRIDVGQVDKISEEVQAYWNTINPAYRHLVTVSNDPYTRRVYIMAPVNGANTVNSMMVLDYLELSTSSLLENAGTLKISGSGKVVTTDLTRKWCPWSITANYAGLRYVQGGKSQMLFCGGGPLAMGATYALTEGSITGIDADYGPFWTSFNYNTSFLLDSDTAQALRLGSHRLSHQFISANIDGVGSVYLIPCVDRLDNQKKRTANLAVSDSLSRDLEFAIWQVGERISYSIQCQPQGIMQPFAPTAPAGIRVSSLTVGMKTDAYSPIRQRNG